MKKISTLITLIAIAGVMLCFTACGEKTKEDMTTMEDEITSMVDDATSMAEGIGDKLTENGNVTDSTDENMLESFVEDMTDMSDMSDMTDDTTDKDGKTDTTAEAE